MWEGVNIQVSGIGAQGGYEWIIASLQNLHYVIHNTKLLQLFFVRYKGMLLSCCTQMKCLQLRGDLKDELLQRFLHAG